MSTETSENLVHFYDTDEHAILCGLRGFAHRSTKHSRGVTCPACVALLADRREAERHGDTHAAAESSVGA
ncbi:hypothetical protein [Anaeromyxobacter oryzae]|uniref:C2H2-type domain-containing protein n=1 Tax=Anaeromyxobacter oryzae TaxID=2918170 RepID=A0ABN6MX72_9BACT|nr:hypothetical protein [Anaeromyxobacter oryzae]BDG05543.1 hypothetical protein AMOR_45390 [Anaeromyxobacter oryzae]